MERLDILLHARGLARSRSQARLLIREARVSGRLGRDWEPLTKPGTRCPGDIALRVDAGDATRFASRGGLKLAAALEHTGMPIRGECVLDVGQSTGGFTDCLLQAGAARVIGIDAGRDQLVHRLREDPRVLCLEGVNARHLPAGLEAALLPAPGLRRCVMDVSFISQTLIVPRLAQLLAPGALLLALVKPQFEVGPQHVGKGGLVRDPKCYPATRERLCQHYRDQGLQVQDYFDSTPRGGDGNREFFIYARRPG